MKQADSTIDKSPEGVATILQLGEAVTTPEGPGKVTDIALNLAEYDGKVLLEPPVIAVQLDTGKTIHVCLCGLDFGDKHVNQYVKDEFARLWPPMDTVPEAETLVPDQQDVNLELHTGLAEQFDTSVLLGDEVEYFAPEVCALAEAQNTGQDIAVVNKLAYLPLQATPTPSQKALKISQVYRDIFAAMQVVPRERLDDLNAWLERQFAKKVQFFLAVPTK
jgi:hypothetical protein